MAIVKANYVKRGEGEKGRAKATIRYITHRRDKDGQKVTRELFGYDGALTKEQVYRMIDEAPQKGTMFYRIVLSPAPKQEDRYKDLNLRDLTIDTMLKLEERIGKQVQFVAAIHDDHSPHRHVHTVVLVEGRRLTRDDFHSLRDVATDRALSQRRLLDRSYGLHLGKSRSRPPFQQRDTTKGRVYRSTPPYQSYTCRLCGYHQAFPYSPTGYRCPADGWHLRRDKPFEQYRTPRREVGLELSLSSP